MSTDVDAILFGFMQALSFGDPKTDALPDFAAAFGELERYRTLKIESAINWPKPAKAALLELLKAWIIVDRLNFETDVPMAYPPGFCDGSSSTRLAEPFLDYIFERSSDLQSLDARLKRALQDQPDSS